VCISYETRNMDNVQFKSHHVHLRWKSMSTEIGIASVEFVDPANLGIAFGISRLSLIELEIY
jgi:hypothetical protein